MGKRRYVRAGVIQPFEGGNRDVARVSVNLVVSPVEFSHRVRKYPKGKLMSVDYLVSGILGCITMNVEDLIANKPLPSNATIVRLNFKPRGSLSSDSNFLVTVSLRECYATIIGSVKVIIDLLDWLNVPFSDFTFVMSCSE